jgi:hypothetical protein
MQSGPQSPPCSHLTLFLCFLTLSSELTSSLSLEDLLSFEGTCTYSSFFMKHFFPGISRFSNTLHLSFWVRPTVIRYLELYTHTHTHKLRNASAIAYIILSKLAIPFDILFALDYFCIRLFCIILFCVRLFSLIASSLR